MLKNLFQEDYNNFLLILNWQKYHSQITFFFKKKDDLNKLFHHTFR